MRNKIILKIKENFDSFLTTLAFFSRFKLKFNFIYDNFSFYLPAVFFIGNIFYIIGLILLILIKIEPLLLNFFIFIFSYYFFNLFHFDGFVDFIDAVFSQKDKEKKKEILKDVHKGSFAIFFGSLYVLCKFILTLKIYEFFYNNFYIKIRDRSVNLELIIIAYLFTFFISFFSKLSSFYLGINTRIINTSKSFSYFQSLLNKTKFLKGLIAFYPIFLVFSFLIFILVYLKIFYPFFEFKKNFSNFFYNSGFLIINNGNLFLMLFNLYFYYFTIFYLLSIIINLIFRNIYLKICYVNFDGVNGDCAGFFIEVNELILLFFCNCLLNNLNFKI
ncbi:MAG: adenosylcobinamide-GDP ribazoletransferase [Spirochaetes bacterium]|nr:adenosylcobinamide-GDP ribazoletransferase [Spirochaetota bacterium]